jgi:hypothetical protein
LLVHGFVGLRGVRAAVDRIDPCLEPLSHLLAPAPAPGRGIVRAALGAGATTVASSTGMHNDRGHVSLTLGEHGASTAVRFAFALVTAALVTGALGLAASAAAARAPAWEEEEALEELADGSVSVGMGSSSHFKPLACSSRKSRRRGHTHSHTAQASTTTVELHSETEFHQSIWAHLGSA